AGAALGKCLAIARRLAAHARQGPVGQEPPEAKLRQPSLPGETVGEGVGQDVRAHGATRSHTDDVQHFPPLGWAGGEAMPRGKSWKSLASADALCGVPATPSVRLGLLHPETSGAS